MPEAEAGGLGGIVKDSSWLMARNVASAAIAFLQGIILARWLGTGDYGLLALIISYVTIVNQVVDFRIYEFATKYVSEFWEKGRKTECFAVVKAAYLLDIATGALAFALVFATAKILSFFILDSPDHANLVIFYAVSLLFSTANGTATALLGVFGKFPWLSLYSMAYASVRFLLIITVLTAQKGLPGVMAAYVAAELLGGLLINFLAFKVVRENLWQFRGDAHLALLRHRFREMVSFLVYTNLNEFLALFTKNIDMLFIGYYRNTTEAGLYKLAKSFAGCVGLLSEPVYTAVFPVMSRMLAAGNQARAVSLAWKITLIAAAVFVPLCLVLVFCGSYIIHYTAGAAYLAAAPALSIMVWGGAIGGIFVWIRPVLLAIGRADVPAKINCISAVLLVLFSVIFVPRFGYLASSAISLLPWVLGHVAALFFLYMKFMPDRGGRM